LPNFCSNAGLSKPMMAAVGTGVTQAESNADKTNNASLLNMQGITVSYKVVASS
jgi:hypothetical protein